MGVNPTSPLFAVARGVLGVLLLPPVSLLLLALAGSALAWRGRRIGGAVATFSICTILLLATPMVSGLLIASLDQEAIAAPAVEPGAIIVLGAEARNGPDGPDVGPLTLERLRRGAVLQRATGLPLLVTGGPPGPDVPPLALAMRAVLENGFAVPVRWVEPAARNTRDNLLLSAAMLGRDGVGGAYLVTHAWHMPRAQREAVRFGLPVLPAIVGRQPRPDGRLTDWLPRADHLAMSWLALHEWTGLAAAALGL